MSASIDMISNAYIHPPIHFKKYTIRILDTDEVSITNAVNLLCSNCPNESGRYEKSRLAREIECINTRPFYKLFWGAYDSDNVLIGIGGIKAADWASDTHILHTMVVDEAHRGKGLGSKLELVRIQWVRDNFSHGRCLVSTKHKKRFDRWGFKIVSEVNDRYLMLFEF